MIDEQRIGFVGVGRRGRSHLRHLYTIRPRDYLFLDPDERSIHDPQNVYGDHSEEGPHWDEDVSDLEPTVTAIFDPSEESRDAAARLCREHGDRPDLFDSFEGFLEAETYDTVVVAAPNHAHTEIVLDLLDRGLNVFSEKPLATTLADHDRIIEAAAGADSVFYTGFNLRHHPTFVRLKEIIDDGAVGRLGMISAHEVRTPFPHGHYYSQEESGGSLLEKDCHDFDWFNWVIGADPVRVAAFGGQHVLSKDTDVNDHATVIVEYENGVKASLELCLYAPFNQARGRVYHVRGSEGIVRTPEKEGAWDLYTRDTRDRFEVASTSGGHGGADLRQMNHFLRVVRGEDEPLATPTDAKKAAAIAIAGERSIEHDTFVTIDENYDVHW